jgi:hypothetical protein
MESNTTHNSTLAIGGVSSPLDSFVVAESSVLRTNFCAEKPAHRQSANRYGQVEKKYNGQMREPPKTKFTNFKNIFLLTKTVETSYHLKKQRVI